jgi:4-carboxymuconolactone decarboxylase
MSSCEPPFPLALSLPLSYTLYRQKNKLSALKRKGNIVDETIKKKTQATAAALFKGGMKIDPPYLTWKEFNRDLANDFSMFITGNLYSRTVLTLPERQMVACAMLAAMGAADELRLHLNAALNVGCDPRKMTEVFFQLAPYGGMPLVNKALEVFREVLKGRGEWEQFKENS